MDDPRELTWLRRLRDLSHRLGSDQSLPELLPEVLDAAVELTEAERGFLVLVQGRKPNGGYRLKVAAARGFGKSAFSHDPDQVSQTVVTQVMERQAGLVTTAEDAEVLQATSILQRRVRSIACVPLELRGELRGVLYLDHRFQPEAFTPRDLPILTTFAGQAALAIETAQLLADRCELGRTLQQLQELRAAHEEPDAARAAAQAPLPFTRFGGLVGGTPVMGALFEEIERAARSRAPVLILGETGSGKELAAREIHARGDASRAPFLVQRCAAANEELLASELFGHRAGAFPGASADRAGQLLDAGRGTVLLDEVGDLTPDLQAALVRVLADGVTQPLGGGPPRPVECRLLAASERDLSALAEAGKFRRDLLYRLDVLRIVVPPLRQRPDDVPLLLEEFFASQRGAAPSLTPAALAHLRGFHWPGNVRQLRNEAQRLAALGELRIDASDLSPELRAGGVPSETYAGKTLAQVEREMIEAALRSCEGNKSRAARQLGIPRTSLYSLLQRHGIG